MIDQSIEEHYQKFLESELDPVIGRDLSSVLAKMGLSNESRLLEAYCNFGSHCVFKVEWGILGTRPCFVSTNPPTEAKPGDIWFDVVELTPMILLPVAKIVTEPNMREWINIHPVYTWQFRTFLRLADWCVIETYFLKANDLMLDRFESLNCMEYVANVYHEEAVAYAHWFGKQLSGQFTLEQAKESLSSVQLSTILPVGLHLWDAAEYPSSEFVRIAVCQETIDKDPDEEFELRGTGKNKSLSTQMIFEEWERRADISFSLAVPLLIGMIKNLPRRAFEFIELRNAAPRPER